MSSSGESIAAEDAIRTGVDNRKRWLSLVALCLGVLMTVLDATIVNVALPSIHADLGFTDSSLIWVINAYLLTFGGLLLLGGKLGDLYGRRRLFLIGIAIFALASLACGVSQSQLMLVLARGAQGMGGAIIGSVSLALIMELFPESTERAKALGIYGFIGGTGGVTGLVLGGFLTDVLSWHWIFLVNVPIGVAVFVVCLYLLPPHPRSSTRPALDGWGAIMVTVSLILANYAIVQGSEIGWRSAETAGVFVVAALLLLAFFLVEIRVPEPLLPMRILKIRSLIVSTAIRVLWATAVSTWSYIAVLYMQLVLGYGSLRAGLAFVPANVIAAVFSLALSARLVARFGIRTPLIVGLLLGAAGLGWFARTPVDGNMATDVVPCMILIGIGAGMVFNPLLLATMRDVAPQDSGLVSGITNTSYLMGGALGLAIVAGFASQRSGTLIQSGTASTLALSEGYRLAFILGALCAGAAAVIALASRLTAGGSGREDRSNL